MGVIPHDCPHCGMGAAGFRVLGVQIEPLIGADRAARWSVAAGAACPRCNGPLAVLLTNRSGTSWHNLKGLLDKFMKEQHAPESIDMTVANAWPRPPSPTVPAHVPAGIERAMLQAERNYPQTGNEEASAMMYRRSLELALKDKFPQLAGTLAARIKTLVADKTLPEAMGQWADEIRDLGNDAAHEPDEIDRSQLTMIRGFTDATLRYLYTLPAEIQARRKVESSTE